MQNKIEWESTTRRPSGRQIFRDICNDIFVLRRSQFGANEHDQDRRMSSFDELLNEYKLYSWKSKGDQIFDEPIKMNDDGLDALRYGIFTHKKKKFNSEYTKIFVV